MVEFLEVLRVARGWFGRCWGPGCVSLWKRESQSWCSCWCEDKGLLSLLCRVLGMYVFFAGYRGQCNESAEAAMLPVSKRSSSCTSGRNGKVLRCTSVVF